jgi:glucosamine 6-phosphate synthetase-like amidotransferase/phosphosugar isomerase protein
MTDKFEKMLLDSEIDNLSDDSEEIVPVKKEEIPVPAQPQISPEANRQMLRKKIAAKKAARGNRNKQMQMNMNKQPPNIDKMLETIMQEDNLKKLMESFPHGKIDPSNIDNKQMELMMQMMQGMNKKN